MEMFSVSVGLFGNYFYRNVYYVVFYVSDDLSESLNLIGGLGDIKRNFRKIFKKSSPQKHLGG